MASIGSQQQQRPQSQPQPQPFLRPYNRATDIEQLVTLICAAMMDFEYYDHTIPGRRQYPLQYWKTIALKVRTRLEWPDVRTIVAEDPATRTVVGFGLFRAYGSLTQRPEWQNDTPAKFVERQLSEWEDWYFQSFVGRATDQAATRLFREQAQKSAENVTSKRGMLELMWLCIDPSHQRRGIGSMLIDWGLRIATELNVPCTLESSVVGNSLYRRKGFRTVEFNVLPPKAGVAEMRMPVMVWEPPSLQGKLLEQVGDDLWRLLPDA